MKTYPVLYLDDWIYVSPSYMLVIFFEKIKFADMKKILELDHSNEQARKAIRRLEPLAAEKREKMKEEMIGKLEICILFAFALSSFFLFLVFNSKISLM